jgi:SAM-dependent methyltransferase
MSDTDKVFAGAVPEVYERYLVPLIFETYAMDIAGRVVSGRPQRVLEIAAGTGVVTRALTTALPGEVSIVATDLSQPMLDRACAVGTCRPVGWRQADAMQLPFEDGQFDAVVCQFGVMFFPDKSKAFAEARRVLVAGGIFIFNVWDRIEDNEFADLVTQALVGLFPADPPRFLARTPYGYHDQGMIERDLIRAGFVKPPEFETRAARSRAASPLRPAIAFCQGTPLRTEIEARGPGRLESATRLCADAISSRFGSESVDAKIQARVVSIEA